MKRRTVLTLGLGTLAGAFGVGLYSWQIEPGWIEVSPLQLPLPRLDPSFHGYRLVQLSDLHCDDHWMTAERLARVVELANGQQPDLIVITGDFVTSSLDDTPQMLSHLRDLRARDGIYAVLGNHDHWSGAQHIRPLLQANGITELADWVTSIQWPGGALLHLAGLDDLWPVPCVLTPLRQHLGRVQRLANQLPAQGTAILLVHEPDVAEVVATVGRFDLQLSGHSHGEAGARSVLWRVARPPLLA